MGSITGERLSNQANASCEGGGAVVGGDALQRSIGGRERTRSQRKPRDERDACGFARVEDGSAVRTVRLYMFCTETIGATERAASSCSAVTSDRSGMPDLPLALQRCQLTDLVLGGELGVDVMQLEQVDGVHAQTAQTHLALLTQVRRITQHGPLVRAGAQQTRLRRDDDPVVGMQRLADQFFGHVRVGGVRGVDEVDSELCCPAQDSDALITVGRWAPAALTRQAHRAEAETIGGEVATEGQGRGHGDDGTPAMTS